MNEPMVWAKEQFGGVDLGDARRTARLVLVASSAAMSPGGTVSSVFDDDAELQGAYDFLESEHIDADALEAGVGAALAQRCASESRILVAVDGSSLTFVDRTGERGLGAVGTYKSGAVGLKVISGLAMSTEGVPLGVLRQLYWKRPVQKPTNRRPAGARPIDKKETRHWLEVVTSCASRINEASASTRITFLVDREGDSASMLSTLTRTGHDFVVRGNWDRTVDAADGRANAWPIRRLLTYRAELGSYDIELSSRPGGRAARTATISVSAACVIIPLVDAEYQSKTTPTLWAVQAREVSGIAKGDEPIEWLLLTNTRVETFEEARAIIALYTRRWRIEEFHRTWKSGHCKVEESQLRSVPALKKWAMILAAIASRVERLKLLARTHPNAPATEEFSALELRSLMLKKGRPSENPKKKKPDMASPGVPTMAQAVLWLAQLGGYTGKSSGGPPGAQTLARGLRRLRDMVEDLSSILEHLRDEMR